jgi:trk system potassium uptake protein TrkH
MRGAPQSHGLLTPSQLAILALLGLIGLGTGLLSLPISRAPGAEVTLLDAFFTATSALCVTGLVVVDTGSAFSIFGTTVILVLFQIGGMGMLLWSSTMIVLLGGQLGLRHRLLMKEQLPGMSMAGAGRLALGVVGFVVCVELLGALLLWICWHDRVPGAKGLYYAFFHSASAFCNAGFSLWPDSLAQDVGHLGVNMIVMTLVVAGGLGYAVVRDIFWAASGVKKRLSVHSQLVLVWSVLLTVGGAALFYLFESTHGGLLQERSWLEKFLIPIFHAGSRTAGLSTIDIGELRPETLQLMMGLMFIGGSPGSTAGGLKVTTFAILVLAAWSQIRGREDVEAFGRRLVPALVLQALALTVIASLCLMAFAFVLNAVEPLPFEDILFETTSALAIVGFSTGVTAKLSTFSKLFICLAMVVGRVGPLTLAMNLLRPRRRSPIRYPAEDVLIG